VTPAYEPILEIESEGRENIMNRILQKLAMASSNVGWKALKQVGGRKGNGTAITPDWAPGPLVRSSELERPELGFPRETDSLCPTCVTEERDQFLQAPCELSEFVHNSNGRIKATLLEENGRIIMRKTCAKHGLIEDVISIDPRFNRLQEQRYYGRDFRTSGDEKIHCHGASNIKYGRGAVLNIDLTNRCNMMCNPCFANANQIGHVHELSMDEIQTILDASLSFKPRRQTSVQFTGGEPTVSPHFLDALRYAREIGYYSAQAATNGIRFALEPDFAKEAKDAGLSFVYLQLDGVGNEANSHRHVSNLFDVKLQAIENLYQAGIDIVPVATIINGVNTDQVGPLIQFVIDNCDKILALSLQPISFTGRDDGVTDEERAQQRYTTSHLAREAQAWSEGKIDPYRDWYPLGAGYIFTALADRLRKPDEKFGGLSISCHPDCGSSVLLVANSKTGTWASLTEFFDFEGFLADAQLITDTDRSRRITSAQAALSFVRHFDAKKAPEGFGLTELKDMIYDRLGGKVDADGRLPKRGDWTLLWIGGMWFQDLWNYDFRRTEMCCIPYGTQEGEISFCAYNTGIGWRQIVEKIHANASTTDWFKTEGRHTIYAGERPIELPELKHTVKVRSEFRDEG